MGGSLTKLELKEAKEEMSLLYMTDRAKLEAQVSVKGMVWSELDKLSPEALGQAGLSWSAFESSCRAVASLWRAGG